MSRAEQFVEVAEKYFEVRFKESQEKIIGLLKKEERRDIKIL